MRAWDRKRQLIWVIGGLIMGTYIAYSDSLDENGNFGRFFIFMEALILLIMAGLFYFYSRKKG